MSPRSSLAVAGRHGAGALALLAAVAAAGCGSDSNGVTTAPGTANVRAVQASPDATGLEVLVDGHAVQTNLQYKQATGYSPVTSGAHVVTVRTTGTPSDSIALPVSLGDGASYTVVSRGLASATGGNFPIGADVLTDDASPGAGHVSVRFVHAAPGEVAMDIYLTAPAASLDGATPTVAGLAYGRGGNYGDVISGTYRLRVTRAGTVDVLLDLPSFILTPGQAYTGVFVGAPVLSLPLELLRLTDQVVAR